MNEPMMVRPTGGGETRCQKMAQKKSAMLLHFRTSPQRWAYQLFSKFFCNNSRWIGCVGLVHFVLYFGARDGELANVAYTIIFETFAPVGKGAARLQKRTGIIKKWEENNAITITIAGTIRTWKEKEATRMTGAAKRKRDKKATSSDVHLQEENNGKGQ